ncbi:hypothetical protein KY285_016612 [Solanum tuberosum]|nr:hypothetical protein KY285_016612 [Solanum tuberosum]
MDTFNSPNLQMVVEEFWDPVRMVFKFVDFDLAPTIEEISDFIEMSYNECEMIVPYKPSSRSLVFPKIKERIDTRLGYVIRDLAQREDEPRKTLVPMIFDGRMFFEGCNILLQLWAIEHFYIRSDAVDTFLGYGNKIDNHPRRMVAFTAPVGFVDWQIFLTELESRHIQWKLHWLSTPHAITMVYHTRSKDSLPSLPNENHKGKRKATNEKVMSKTIEKKLHSDELVSSLEKKIRELEEEVSDMRERA